ncbi:Creatinase/aminopeptidase [Laetiporus sulphureus 93-53]|uniref:Creatinase/aminopeptidase n=1 Tax=Laetiporus sulphureus 93-53 TaxID=1314785 RepID=A0A165D635_9APHY|nr:Creatinase/aminopeptidase [Laetiporus sulphureus 93-53]KZT04219.1 Creatinase/aminopeptidase [Laetiporus sulphureus 93-53]
MNNRSDSYKSNSSRSTDRSGGSGMRSGRSGGSSKRPGLESSQSSDTLVGSAYERKVSDLDPIPERVDTTGRLTALRELMQKETLDYYIIPTEDAHGSEYVAINDKRREWISGFTGSAGQAIISRTNAYLATDARYWIQAREQLDENWILIEAGSVGGPADWISWLSDRAKDARIGIDSRMVSYEKATKLNQALVGKSCKLVYPPQNLVDLIWVEKPSRSKEPIFVQPHQFTGKEAGAKLAELRAWIGNQAPTVPSYSKEPPKPSQMQVATLISSLPSIAYVLNLRGDDIPFNPVFHAYLFVSLTQAILFIEPAKVSKEVDEYLQSIGVERMEYNEIWGFIRRKPWGEGKVIITPETSYAISLILTSFRYTVLPSYVDEMKAIKNRSEIEGLQHAYLRDGCAFVRFLAWLEEKIRQGYEITEYEAAWRLTEYRRKQAHYMGLAYENISASGPNAALPHYSPRKSTAIYIDRKTPYLNDSGGQYQDGTCDTTRTIHFGQPTDAQCEAFTRVLQGHIAIDSAIFPEGTSGAKLDVLARRALWQDGLNYMHGTGHGVGSYLTVHEGPHGFSSDVPLKPGHVITNEPGFYKEGEWGIRIESALFVKPVTTRGEFNGAIWLGFERLTCVPIQTKMVKDVMLSKEERQWLKSHNARCLDLLTPLLQEQNDQRALKWLRREASRGIGAAKSGPGGISIDWD